jgi:hypothetical protein
MADGCSKGGKICAVICAVISVVVVAAVVTGVLVAPKVAQYSMDQTQMAMPNVSLLPCKGFGDNAGPGIAEVVNAMNYKFAAPLGLPLSVNLEEFNVSMYGYVPNKTLMGTFRHPKVTLSAGSNPLNFTVSFWSPRADIVVQQWLLGMIPMNASAPPPQLPMSISAQDIEVKVGPMPVKHLKVEKDFSCVFLAQLEGVNYTKPYCPTVGPPDLAISMTCSEAALPPPPTSREQIKREAHMLQRLVV